MLFFERVYLQFYQRTGGGTLLGGAFLAFMAWRGPLDWTVIPIALAIAIGVDGVALWCRRNRRRRT